jgi:hypothetical protein
MTNLAIRVRDARDAGRKWDGPGGIVDDPSFPEISSGDQGRKLLRLIAANKRTADGRIAESYERTPQVRENRRRLAALRRAAAPADVRPLTGHDWQQVIRALTARDDDELPVFGRFPA